MADLFCALFVPSFLTMKNILSIILTALAITGATLLLMRHCAGPSVVVREVVHSDTVTLVQVDTVVVEKPVLMRIVEQRTDTLVVYRDQDTVFVPVPIRQYQFRDSLYTLDISGYAVSIDRLEIYPRTVYRTINTTTERIITDKKHWGLGIQAGYGYNFNSRKLSPYIGIGVQYSIVKW